MYGTPGVSSAPVPKYVAELRANLTSAYQQVRTTTAAKLKRQKEFYDRMVHGQPFNEGDLVWLNSPAVPKGNSKKLHCPLMGPFRVVRRLSEAVYRIQHRRNRRKRLVVHPDTHPLQPGDPVNRDSLIPPVKAAGAPLPLPPPLLPPPAPRYPRRNRAPSD